MSRIKLYPAFEHWQERGNIILFSDPHWDDPDCKLMDSNWLEPKYHIKKLLSGIKSGDTVVCLGDVGNPSYMEWIKRKRSHLRTVLICGNHDGGVSNYKDYFDEIYTGPVFIAPQILLSHEPVPTGFAVNIHGHTHNSGFVALFGPSLECAPCYNLASNVVGWTAFNLNDSVNSGLLKDIPTIHQITIDKATKEKDAKISK